MWRAVRVAHEGVGTNIDVRVAPDVQIMTAAKCGTVVFRRINRFGLRGFYHCQLLRLVAVFVVKSEQERFTAGRVFGNV